MRFVADKQRRLASPTEPLLSVVHGPRPCSAMFAGWVESKIHGVNAIRDQSGCLLCQNMSLADAGQGKDTQSALNTPKG